VGLLASQPPGTVCPSVCLCTQSLTTPVLLWLLHSLGVRLSRPLLDRLSCSLQYDEPILSRLYRTVKGKGSPYQVVLYTMMLVYRTTCPYSTAERRVPELIPVLGSQPAGDVSHKPGSRLPLLSARPAVTLATLRMAATSFAAWWTEADGCEQVAYKTVTRQRRGCDLNPGPSAPESSTLTTQLPSHPYRTVCSFINQVTVMYADVKYPLPSTAV